MIFFIELFWFLSLPEKTFGTLNYQELLEVESTHKCWLLSEASSGSHMRLAGRFTSWSDGKYLLTTGSACGSFISIGRKAQLLCQIWCVFTPTWRWITWKVYMRLQYLPVTLEHVRTKVADMWVWVSHCWSGRSPVDSPETQSPRNPHLQLLAWIFHLWELVVFSMIENWNVSERFSFQCSALSPLKLSENTKD